MVGYQTLLTDNKLFSLKETHLFIIHISSMRLIKLKGTNCSKNSIVIYIDFMKENTEQQDNIGAAIRVFNAKVADFNIEIGKIWGQSLMEYFPENNG